MRRAPRAILACLLSLPLLGGALISLTQPPLAPLLPAPVLAIAREVAMPFHALIGRIDPDSWIGALFYGTYDPLVPLLGSSALAAHALLLALPPFALALWILRPRRSMMAPRSDGASEGR